MPDPLDIKTVGGGVLSDEQAKVFALSISAAVKAYIKAHQAEFEAWAKEHSETNDFESR